MRSALLAVRLRNRLCRTQLRRLLRRTPKQRLQPRPLRFHHRRMPPEAPAVSIKSLRHARCLFHPLREAAARCPHCGGTYCRECVTDEDGKLACPPCLRRLSHPPAQKASLARSLREILGGLTVVVGVGAVFFLLLSWRVDTPEQHLNFSSTILVQEQLQK